ncbi:DUF5627 domain-containing protein [Confluentibacter flavum]|uniref:Adhesin n=1 Tax=Confluentibacter flavum TaxID=1909700 RepID=A0A2N3HFA5_9FLAO|nr:DUF5627 domain-containing protein [Confluentibacter flavum]PKQ43582.1 adhesin [Confluentibacter flavum]
MKNKVFIMFIILLVSLTSCENNDWEFDDYEFQSVYFAYQYPVRTLTLGEDIFDTSLDNEHKSRILATLGGVYQNDNDVTIGFSVDNSLVSGLLFGAGENPIVPMPSNYYNLASDKMIIPKGEIIGGVEVEFTDAFFADPLATQTNYVIPIRMNNVVNADTILSGQALVSNPKRGISENWSIQPKDFIFYAVKYVNPWHGIYLRRGEDEITGKNGNTSLDEVITRHEDYVEYDEVFNVNTQSLTKSGMQVVFKDANGVNINCDLILTFDNDGNCVVSTNSTDFTATGNGKFVTDGEKNSWGSKDRDALYLDYEIDLEEMHITTKDTLVLRNRGVIAETFSPVVQ